jgi:alkanesulfonate monooxygenase SsuD/methylene tetrahydromethanopterin reductase-like flavin-dependent oxidoreductase (luciferase family)
MLVGALVPFHDTGGDPDTVREHAQALEAAGYDFLEAPDHVLGANVASRPGLRCSHKSESIPLSLKL